MTEMVFAFLEKVGFNHPLHPALTHLPMGAVMAAFFFVLIGSILKKNEFFVSTTHCLGLGLLTVIPTAIAGYMDWQHSFDGEWETAIIIKIILAILLTLFLALAFNVSRKQNTKKTSLLVLIGCCLACAIGLGFTGGELLYG